MQIPNYCCHTIKQDNRQVLINETVGYLFFAIAIKDKMNKNQVMMEVFKSCPTLTWAEIKLNEDRLFSAYCLGCTFREVYNEAMNLDKKSKWQDTNDNL